MLCTSTPPRRRRPLHRTGSVALAAVLALTTAVLAATTSPASAAGRFDFHIDFKHQSPNSPPWPTHAGETVIQSACNGPQGYRYQITVWWTGTGVGGVWGGPGPWSKPVTYTCTNKPENHTFGLPELEAGQYYFVATKAKDGVKLHLSGNVFYP